MEPHFEPPPQKIEYGTYKSYSIGFLLSLLLTFAAYFLAINPWLSRYSGWIQDSAISFAATVQAVIQLLLFLNLIAEPRPRWNLVVFLFMLLVVAILVIGSLWIMYHLNYNLMPTSMPQ